ncbi:MAG: AAA family ATPase [Clostridia bacterium]|nr:AAA family ATPase [Clostridia bacterium]
MAHTREEIERFSGVYQTIRQEIAKDMIGQDTVVEHLLECVIAGGNLLLEGVPGLGKTHLVRTLSKVLDLPFSRIQFTPDLMPADITGTNILVQQGGENTFRFQEGPLFASIVLADEINRATPKTQSALLEAMQEHAVTAGGKTRKLPEPYFVLATQNPVEQEGTYPLPEAQMDRFLMKVLVPFPSLSELQGIVELTTGGKAMSAGRVAGREEILSMRAVAQEVPIAASVMESALKLIVMTHPESAEAPEKIRRYVRFGASPRGAQALIALSRVRALAHGRYNVSFEDIRALAPEVLRHRMAMNFEGLSEGVTPDDCIAELLTMLPGA